jgi:hypothetical protein
MGVGGAGVAEGADTACVADALGGWGATVADGITTAVMVGGMVKPGALQASAASVKTRTAVDTANNAER